MNDEKKTTAWAAMLSQLSPKAKRALRRDDPSLLPETQPPPASDEQEEYRLYRSQLSPKAQNAVDELQAPDGDNGEVLPDKEQARYVLVEQADGEIPQIRLFRSAITLAQRIGQLEGTDMFAVPLLGIPLQFTHGPQRHLLLPDGISALTVPVVKTMEVKVVTAEDALQVSDLQEDFYIGPAVLMEQMAKTPSRSKASKDARNDEDDDDEDEDD